MYRISTAGGHQAISVPPQGTEFGSLSGIAAGSNGKVFFSEMSTDRLEVIKP